MIIKTFFNGVLSDEKVDLNHVEFDDCCQKNAEYLASDKYADYYKCRVCGATWEG